VPGMKGDMQESIHWLSGLNSWMVMELSLCVWRQIQVCLILEYGMRYSRVFSIEHRYMDIFSFWSRETLIYWVFMRLINQPAQDSLWELKLLIEAVNNRHLPRWSKPLARGRTEGQFRDVFFISISTLSQHAQIAKITENRWNNRNRKHWRLSQYGLIYPSGTEGRHELRPKSDLVIHWQIKSFWCCAEIARRWPLQG
jgi:hypothetical protein